MQAAIMDSKLDPLEKEAFKELAICGAHIDGRTLLTTLLDRQSLTETPVDYSRGLKEALRLAQDCKVHPLRHSSSTRGWILKMTACSTDKPATAHAGSAAH